MAPQTRSPTSSVLPLQHNLSLHQIFLKVWVISSLMKLQNPPGVEGEDKPVIQSPSARLLQGPSHCGSGDVCQHDYSTDSDVANELALHSSALNTEEEVLRLDSATLDHSRGAVLPGLQ